jgi:hypothetical protein
MATGGTSALATRGLLHGARPLLVRRTPSTTTVALSVVPVGSPVVTGAAAAVVVGADGVPPPWLS